MPLGVDLNSEPAFLESAVLSSVHYIQFGRCYTRSVRKSIRIVGVSLLIVSAMAWRVTAFQRGNSGTTSPPTEESLETSAAKFVKILKDKDINGLASEFSKNGVYLGVDSDKLPYKQAVKSLNEKSGVYHVFFETELVNGKRDPGAMVCLRDQLTEAKSIKVHVNIATEKGKIYGTVTISAVGNPIFGDQGDAFCDVVYARENGEWKITSVQYV
jgi:hypothetical protein